MDTAQFKVPWLVTCASCGIPGDVPGFLPGWSITVVVTEMPTPTHGKTPSRFDFVTHCPDHTD